jgi:N-acetyl-anhydromuramyl-L-alanine amidase AmpD
MSPQTTEKLLPSWCYSPHNLISQRGIVIHYISAINVDPDNWGSVQACYDLLKRLRVSAHYLIGRDGETVQLVPTHHRAWHAGVSSFGGMKNLNNYFFGIELVATHTSGFTDEQYDALQELCAFLVTKYHISTDFIVGHSDVGQPPGRKIDPGPSFDWSRLHAGLRAV